MNASIDIYGFKIAYDEFRSIFKENASAFLSKLILEYQPAMGAPRKHKLYSIVFVKGKKYYIFPRMTILFFMKNRIINNLSVNFIENRANVTRKNNFSLYGYQTVVVDYLCKNIYSDQRKITGTSSCVLNLQAGAGKTFVAAEMIARLGVKTLYITVLKHLAQQAYNDMSAALNANIVISNKYSVGDVTIMVINSALKMPATDINKYSFIIFDEVHTLCSEQRSKIFTMMNAKYMLAMSATTDQRNDGFDTIYKKHLGDVVYAAKIPNFDFRAIEFKLNIKFIKYYGSGAYTKNLTHSSTGKTFVHYMYNQFMRDSSRMKVICDEINRLLEDPKRNIYIFAEEVKNLQDIIAFYTKNYREKLQDIALYDKDLIGYFVGGISVGDAQHIKDTSRLVFTTYNLSSTGTSWTKMNAMILATPRKSGIEQLAARILRQGSDITYPREIIDIVDMKTCLKRQMKKRKRSFKIYNPKLEKIVIRKQKTKIGYEIGFQQQQIEIID